MPDLKNKRLFLLDMHGTDVAFSAVYTQKLREKLLTVTKPSSFTEFDRTEWGKRIKEIYTSAANGIIAFQNKIGSYEQNRTDIYKNKWNEICTVLSKSPSSDEMIGYLKSIELNIEDFEKTYSEKKRADAIWFAKDLKDRYSVLWLYYDLFYNKSEEKAQ